MNRDEAFKLLPEYVRNEISKDQREEINTWINKDAGIQKELQKLRKIDAMSKAFRDAPFEFSPHLIDSVMAKIENELLPAPRRSKLPTVLTWIFFLSAACLAMVTFLPDVTSETLSKAMNGIPAAILAVSAGSCAVYAMANRHYRLGVAAMSFCFVVLAAHEVIPAENGFITVGRSPTADSVLMKKLERQDSPTDESSRPQEVQASGAKEELLQNRAEPAKPIPSSLREGEESKVERRRGQSPTAPKKKSDSTAIEPQSAKRSDDADVSRTKRLESAPGIASEQGASQELDVFAEADPRKPSAIGAASEGAGNSFAAGSAPPSSVRSLTKTCSAQINSFEWNVPMLQNGGLRIGVAAAQSPFDSRKTFLLISLVTDETQLPSRVPLVFSKKVRAFRLIGGPGGGKLLLDARALLTTYVLEVDSEGFSQGEQIATIGDRVAELSSDDHIRNEVTFAAVVASQCESAHVDRGRLMQVARESLKMRSSEDRERFVKGLSAPPL